MGAKGFSKTAKGNMLFAETRGLWLIGGLSHTSVFWFEAILILMFDIGFYIGKILITT